MRLALLLVLLHGPDGHEIRVNPHEITNLRASSEAQGKDNKYITDGVRCIVYLTDGKFVSVVESCAEVTQTLERSR